MNQILDRLNNTLKSYFTLSGYLVSQADAEAAIRDGVSFRGTNIVILIIAIFIASLGLNTNSTAVIIGAMLISPLMGPIIGIGLGVGIEDYELLKTCVRNLVMAALFSVIASTIYFLISPVSEGHSELLARTSPTIYDVLIGFFGGAAGIIAIGSRSKGNVIPGVAIATALMPPLCTVGYGIATWQPTYFLGALYLFLINSVYIALATFIGVKLMKYQKKAQSDENRARRIRRVVYTVAILAMIPSLWLTYRMLQQSRFEINAQRFVNEQFRFPSTTVLSESATNEHGHRSISVTLIGKILPADSLQAAMEKQLPTYSLEGVQLNIIQGDMRSADADVDLSRSSLRDIYQLSQQALAQKQHAIDSLSTIINATRMTDSVSGAVMPELKIVFPRVTEFAMTRAVFASAHEERLDTVNTALIKTSSGLSAKEKDELTRYLQARLNLKDVRIVEVGTSISFPVIHSHNK